MANADPKQMVHTIDHMSNKVANQITAAAKVSNLCGPLQHSFMYLDICVMDVQPTIMKGKKEFLEELIVQYNICVMTEPLSQTISEPWCSDNNSKMCGSSVHHLATI